MILWSDASLLVVNKPAGMRTIPDGYHPELPTLVSTLQPEWGKCWVVHRLDKDTSGVLILARIKEAHRGLSLQFENRQVQKVYHAVVIGNPPWEELVVNSPLLVNGDRRHRTVVDLENGKSASTSIRVIHRYSEFCLLEAQPHSGYTHQIRAHLSSAGFPLVGDPLYSYITMAQRQSQLHSPPASISRTALHALSIRFTHPVSGTLLFFEAPYPDDFRGLLNSLP